MTAIVHTSTIARDWALYYAGMGLAVLPLWATLGPWCDCGNLGCPSPGKHPLGVLVAHGRDDASTDPGLISEWFTRYPMANLGVRPPEGVAILDVDPRNLGEATMAELQHNHGALPATLEAATGGGGRHLWFAYAGRARGRLGPGVDIKTSSGFVVVPPSIHASGRRYTWTHEMATAPAPGWLRQLLDPPRGHRVAGRGGGGRGLVRAVAEAAVGERNNLLHWAACRAFEAGQLDVLDDLVDAAVGNGLSPREAHLTVRSAERTVTSWR